MKYLKNEISELWNYPVTVGLLITVTIINALFTSILNLIF